MMNTQSELSIDQLVQALQDVNTQLNQGFLSRLSDIDRRETVIIKQTWPTLPGWWRTKIFQEIEKLSSQNNLVDFSTLCTFAVEDEEDAVRLAAVRTLWDYDHQANIGIFLALIEREKDPAVRGAAARGLGRFIYAGEIDEIPATKLELIENRLLDLYNEDREPGVRLAALESLGYSSREEIPALIREVFSSPENKWKASALLAMGRSANQEWQPEILTMLDSKYLQLQIEAVRSAGELELQAAVPALLELLDEAEGDLRRACIWSLSQIGGEDATEKLDSLYDESEDDEEFEFIEAAIENLSFTDGAKIMPLFDLPEDEDLEDDDDFEDDLDDLDPLDELLEEDEDDLD